MLRATNLGYPRIGAHRELKRAVEAYWAGDLSEAELQARCRALRAAHWTLQQDLGLDHIPSNDFSLYDHVLDAAAMVGAVPERFGRSDEVDLETYFAMARGRQADAGDDRGGVPAMEMTKWFDTNYHYIVPEFEANQTFHLASTKVIDEFEEAKALGIMTRPVVGSSVTHTVTLLGHHYAFVDVDGLGDGQPYTVTLDGRQAWPVDERFPQSVLRALPKERLTMAFGSCRTIIADESGDADRALQRHAVTNTSENACVLD